MIVSHGSGGPNGGSCTRYFIGDFDGKTFKSDYPVEQVNWLDYGKDNYAGVTWSDIPDQDGRRLFLGWMSNWQYATKVPTNKWRSAMTLPRKLELLNTTNGIKLFSKPVKELEKLRKSITNLSENTVIGRAFLQEVNPSQLEVELTFDIEKSDSKAFGIELLNSKGEYIRISFDKASNLIIIDRSNAGKMDFSPQFPGLHYIPYTSANPEMKWHLFFDQSSLELFVNDGEMVATDIFFPNKNFDQVSLFAFNGVAKLKKGVLYELTKSW